jgi:hypothetical protein
MSFTRLLAAGRSIMGIKKQPGPYRMNQEHLLPKFAPAPKSPGAAAAPKLTDVGPGSGAPTAFPSDCAIAPPTSAAALAVRPDPIEDRSRWSFIDRWFRRVPGVAGRKGKVRRPGSKNGSVQTELSLDAVKVVRNDLAEGDFDIALASNKGAVGRQSGMVWNRLSARLLRQAALEFNLVQKERGKLLSQAGHDAGGARRA